MASEQGLCPAGFGATGSAASRSRAEWRVLLFSSDSVEASHIVNHLEATSLASKLEVASTIGEVVAIVIGVRADLVLIDVKSLGGLDAGPCNGFADVLPCRPRVFLISDDDVVSTEHARRLSASGFYYKDKIGPSLARRLHELMETDETRDTIRAGTTIRVL